MIEMIKVRNKKIMFCVQPTRYSWLDRLYTCIYEKKSNYII